MRSGSTGSLTDSVSIPCSSGLGFRRQQGGSGPPIASLIVSIPCSSGLGFRLAYRTLDIGCAMYVSIPCSSGLGFRLRVCRLPGLQKLPVLSQSLVHQGLVSDGGDQGGGQENLRASPVSIPCSSGLGFRQISSNGHRSKPRGWNVSIPCSSGLGFRPLGHFLYAQGQAGWEPSQSLVHQGLVSDYSGSGDPDLLQAR